VFESSVDFHAITRGGRRMFVATVRDMTERLRQEQAALEVERLREERKYLRQQELLIRDLHDGIGGITANLGMMAALGMKAPGGAAKDDVLRRVADLAAEGSAEVRGLMNSLESRDMLWGDLLVEMRRHGAQVLEQHGVDFTLETRGDPPAGGLGLFPGMSLLRILKEALNNVLKHAGATAVQVRLDFTAVALELSVQDNGRGLPEPLHRGRGLGNMRQRARDLGGRLELTPGPGLRVTCRFALPLISPEGGMDPEPPVPPHGA